MLCCHALSRAVFTTEDGVTCVCALGEVEVLFEDLFQPIPSSRVSQQVVTYGSNTDTS